MAAPSIPPPKAGDYYIPLNGWTGSDANGYTFFCEGLAVGWWPGSGGGSVPVQWYCLTDGTTSLCLYYPTGYTPLPIYPWYVAAGPFASSALCVAGCAGAPDPDPDPG